MATGNTAPAPADERPYNVLIERVTSRNIGDLRGFNPLVDLRTADKMPAVYDQQRIGSCTAQALCAAFAFTYPYRNFNGSRLFVYYNERLLDQSIADDRGSYLRTGIRTFEKYGVCSEDLWPDQTPGVV